MVIPERRSFLQSSILFNPYFASTYRFSCFLSFLPPVLNFIFRFLRPAFYPLFYLSFISLSQFSLSRSFFPIDYIYVTGAGWDQQRLPHSFFKVLRSEKCHARTSEKKYNGLHFLRWVQEDSGDNAKRLLAIIQYKASRCKHSAFVSGFPCSNDAVLPESNTQRTGQVLRTSTPTSV